MLNEINVLVVDDEENLRMILKDELSRKGYNVKVSANGTEALNIIDEDEPDVVLLDIVMPKPDGMSVLKSIKQNHPDCEVIMLTAYGAIDTAIESMKLGAYDYVTKPYNLSEILILIQKAKEKKYLVQKNRIFRQALSKRDKEIDFIGNSLKMQMIKQLVEKVADTNCTVLICGETGTGKEIIAYDLHRKSSRNINSFVAINCGALPETLLESELFGHEKGSFTGAISQKHGLFEVADDGTLFLDEIADMPPPLQVKLLRVLENGEFRRVGGTKNIKVNVRIISATNRDLEKERREGRFRDDLYYRLNVVTINLPPLRERKEDIPDLVRHFIKKYSLKMGKRMKEISNGTLNTLINYHWPGNIRELENIIESTLILCDEDTIQPYHISSNIRKITSISNDENMQNLEKVEIMYIMEVLNQCKGDKVKAAKLLGIGLRTLYRKIKKDNKFC